MTGPSQARAAWGEDPSLVTDIAFPDAVADPFGQIARVYGAIGLGLSGEAEAAIMAWFENRPREPVDRPRYSAQEFGLSDGQINDRFASYNQRFRPE